MGLLGGWRLARGCFAHQGRSFRPAGDPVSEFCDRRWRPGPERGGWLPAERGRYHLYISLACPWAHRTLIFRALKKLDDVISVSITEPLYGKTGWEFGTAPGTTPDTANGKSTMAEVYLLADPHYTGRVSVPVLWDKTRRTIVNNESAEIIRMLNAAFDAFTEVKTDYYPRPLRAEIDRINDLVYPNVNNGVYRAGFATSQAAYEEAARGVFTALDQLEQALSGQRYLAATRSPKRIGGCSRRSFASTRLLQPFQMQPAPHHRLSQSVELSARALSGAAG